MILWISLASVALEDVIKFLHKRQDLLEEEFLELLITPNLSTLDLSLTENISDMHQLLQLATTYSPVSYYY